MGVASETRAISLLSPSIKRSALDHLDRLSKGREREIGEKPWLKAVLTQVSIRLATGALQSHARKASRVGSRRRAALAYWSKLKMLGIPRLLSDRKLEDRDALRRTARKLPRDQYLAMSKAERKAWYTAESERLRLYQEQWAQTRGTEAPSLTGDWLRAGSETARLPTLKIKRT